MKAKINIILINTAWQPTIYVLSIVTINDDFNTINDDFNTIKLRCFLYIIKQNSYALNIPCPKLLSSLIYFL